MSASMGTGPVVIACGQRLRGDDAVAFELIGALDDAARRRASIVEADALDISQLLDLPDGARCIVVDAVASAAPGALVEIDLARLAEAELDPSQGQLPCSSHALLIPQTLAFARLLRGRAIAGALLGVGIAQCRPGAALSPAVANAVQPGARALAALIARYASEDTPAC
jgi:hydrogenase maturation protease